MKAKHFLFRYILLGIFFSAIPFVQLRGGSNFHFKHIRVDDGLSESTVYCILQDSEGFMWFGTKDGLNRFDGTGFRTFRHDPKNPQSIGNNFIRCIIEGKNKKLYLGTDAGIYIMDPTDETAERFSRVTNEKEEIECAVNALETDLSGNIWIGTVSQGMFLYRPETRRLEKVPVRNHPIRHISSVYCDRVGTVWAGTRHGLLRYNSRENVLEAAPNFFNPDNATREILCISEDRNANLWLGTWADGIRSYNKQTGQSTSFLGKNDTKNYITHVRTLFPYTEHTFLIGSDDGLYLFDIKEKTVDRLDVPKQPHSLSDQNVYAIVRDKEDGIWIGTYFGGINYLNPSLLTVETYYSDALQGSLSGKAVSQFREDSQGNLWIATEDGGVNYFNTKTKEFTQPIRTSYHNTHALLLDEDDLWIGTFSRGIDVYNVRTGVIRNFRHDINNKNTLNDDCIFSLYKTKNGDIYAGTPVGLNKYDRKSGSFSGIPEITHFIYDMQEDDYGNFWLAAYGGGAMRREPETGTWIHYDTVRIKNNPIVGSKLTSIYIDSQKRVIFSSEGQGIFLYDYQTDNFKNISEINGLPNNVVYGILDDPAGNLWLSCNRGLVCWNEADPENYRLYDKENGLQSNQFNYKSSYKASDGKFYFGGINGFSCFYPLIMSKNKNTVVPGVKITGIKLLGESDAETDRDIRTRLNRKEKIRLPSGKSSFTISYISLSYISQENNQYAYRLEGIDSDWNFAGNNKQVTYVNPAPGKYYFRVKGSNNDGVWNEEGALVEIEILPPFWLGLPAKISYMVLALIAITLLILFFIRKNKKKQIVQLEAFKAEQESLAFKSKIDFFTNITHEIRTPLSLIHAPLEEIIGSGEGGSETKQNLSIIEKNCERLTELIDQLLDFRKMDADKYPIRPEPIRIRDLCIELFERFRKTTGNRKISLILDIPEDCNPIITTDSDALMKIVGNLLTNALKFTRDTIFLRLREDENKYCVINVEDNGPGISEELKGRIFDPFYQIPAGNKNAGVGIGLSLVKHLSELLKGEISVKNNVPTGSIFTFSFSDMHSGSEPEEKKTESSNRSSGKNILVIDDHPDMILFLKNSLQSTYTTDTALNASEALLRLEEKSYDLIISDVMMPDIDGIDFTRRIKSDPNYSHIPVILLSAKTGTDTKVEGLHSGADVFIEKPFSTYHLKAQINSLLNNRKALLETFNRSPLTSYSALATNKSDEIFLTKLNDEIEKHLIAGDFCIESLADILCVSRSNLQRKLKSICGVTPGDYLRNYRLKKACKLLLETDLRINEVAYYVGFNSPSYFTKVFYKCYNMSPKEFVANNKVNQQEK